MIAGSEMIVLFRIGERLTLTLVVLIVATVVMVGFWRTVQQVNLTDGGKLGVAGSFAFSTPVFVLLSIVGYAYVSLSHPITVQPGGLSGEAVAGTPQPGGFIGATPMAAVPVGDQGHARVVAERKIRSLNCLVREGVLSARMEDDLALVKLDLMAPVWDESWGSADSFRDWATGLSEAAPDPEARAAFDALHVAC